jgi:uncharacterized protein YndB with AHSA1/START domain
MTTAAETLSVVTEKEMSHPPEKVWRALTETSLLDEWLMKNDFRPVVGHKFSLRTQPVGNWNGIIDCEVLAVEPHRRLSYTWVSGIDALRVQSVVTWTLKATSGGTLVRMEQSGFRADQGQNYQGAKYGWQLFFGGLERVLGGLA